MAYSIEQMKYSGLRIMYNRVVVAAALYSCIVLCFNLSVILPESVFPYYLPLLPIAYIIAQLLDRSKPTTTIIRSFNHSDYENILINKILPPLSIWSRIVWLTNTKSTNPLPLVYSPVGLMFFPYACVLSLIVIIVTDGSVSSFILGLLAIVPAHFMLAAISGNNFRMGILSLNILISIRVLLNGEFKVSNIFILIFINVCLFYFLKLFKSLSVRKRFIKNKFDFLWLKMELFFPMWILPRFISSGVTIVDSITVTQEKKDFWKKIVSRLLKKSKVVLAEVSGLQRNSSLAWEIQQSVNQHVRLVLLCQKKDYKNVLAILQELSNDIPILNHSSFKSVTDYLLSEDNPSLIVLISYEDEVHLEKLIYLTAEGAVRFSDIDWVKLIYLRDEINTIKTFKEALFNLFFSSQSLQSKLEFQMKIWSKLNAFHHYLFGRK